jgi:hypothetical protein
MPSAPRTRPRFRARVLIGAGLLSALAMASPSAAAVFQCPAGDVACLIWAIEASNWTPEPNTLLLAAGTYTLTAIQNWYDGANGLPPLTSVLTIVGAGAQSTLIARATGSPGFRFLYVTEGGVLTLSGLTLQGGVADDGGGALVNSGTLTLTNSILAMNTAYYGGGLLNYGIASLGNSTLRGNGAFDGGGLLSDGGTVTLTNTTIADNAAELEGGGLFNLAGTLVATSSTLARNQAQLGGGGLKNAGGLAVVTNTTIADNHTLQPNTTGGGINNSVSSSPFAPPTGTVVLQNTILALNTAGSAVGSDCSGAFTGISVTSLGNNLIGTLSGCPVALRSGDRTGDPGLGAFTDDGSPGHGYFPLTPNSPAIDAANPAACPATDQLGQPRVGVCEIGAIEFQPPGSMPAAALGRGP